MNEKYPCRSFIIIFYFLQFDFLKLLKHIQIKIMTIIFGSSINQINDTLQIFTFNKQIKKKFDYKNNNLSEIISNINQINLFEEKNSDLIYVIQNASFLTEKNGDNLLKIKELIETKKEIICLIVARNASLLNKNIAKLKSVKLLKATKFNQTSKIKFIDLLKEKFPINFNSSDDLNYLIDHLQNDSHSVINEIKKISDFSYEKKINQNQIKKLIFGYQKEIIFDLAKFIIAGDLKKSMNLFKKLIIEKYNVVALIQIISQQMFEFKLLKILFETSTNNLTAISKQYGINAYILKKNYELLNNITLNQIKQILNNLYKLDMQIKNNIILPESGFVLFLINNCYGQ